MPGTGGGGGMGANYLGTAIAGYNVFAGLVNKSKANAEANYLEQTKPVKKTSQFDRDALSLTESDLANGMSAEAEQAYDDADARAVSSSISAILKSGGSANNIADMYGNSAEGRQQLSVIRDQMRMKNVEKYLSQLDNMAAEEEKNGLVNEYGPYINKLKAVGEAKKAAAEQTAKGLDSLGGMGGSGGGGGFNLGSMLGGGGASSGGGTGAGGSISGGGGGPMPSDKRLKHNIQIVGKSPSGINICEFSYVGSNTRYRGVLAQDVPFACTVGEGGYKWVNYDLIDVKFKML